jgi:hypothetical protein
MMAAVTTKHAGPAEVLGDETFMSADSLRTYMNEMSSAKLSNGLEAMAKADEARQELIKTMQQTVDVTQAKVAELKRNLAIKLKSAAERGDSEVMVMRFPNSLCTDKGRAINNSEPDWPETLTGRPLQAFEFWRSHLKPANYRLTAMIVDWPGGLPGDVAFYIGWK